MSGAIASMVLSWPAIATAQSGSVAFTSFRAGAARVYAVNADGGAIRALTHTSGAAFEGSPAFSPDGRRIAYTCGNFELCVMNADGSAQARVTTNDWPREFRYDTSPAWSPDGSRLIFVRTVAGNDQIWTVGIDGSGLRQVPVPAGVNGDPSFSPDATTIVFEHANIDSDTGDVPTSSDSGIYLIGADGSAARRVTGPGTDASDPAWSPDGRSIAFTRSTDATSPVVVMNADGSGQRTVSPRSTYAADPAWSPDGRTIVFASTDARGVSLKTVPASGGSARRLTTGRGPDLTPAWQPTGLAAPGQLPLPTAAPSSATTDARVVGVLLRTSAELGLVLGAPDRSSAQLRAGARRVQSLARRIDRAARPLRPATRRGRRVRTRILQATSVLKGIASEMRKLSGSVRRHDRRAARLQRNNIGGGVFGMVLVLGDGAGIAGMSQAM